MRQDLAQGHPRALQRLQRHAAGAHGPGALAEQSRAEDSGPEMPRQAVTSGEREVGDQPQREKAGAGGGNRRDRQGLASVGSGTGSRGRGGGGGARAGGAAGHQGPRPSHAHALPRRKRRRSPAWEAARALWRPLVVGGARCRLAAWNLALCNRDLANGWGRVSADCTALGPLEAFFVLASTHVLVNDNKILHVY